MNDFRGSKNYRGQSRGPRQPRGASRGGGGSGSGFQENRNFDRNNKRYNENAFIDNNRYSDRLDRPHDRSNKKRFEVNNKNYSNRPSTGASLSIDEAGDSNPKKSYDTPENRNAYENSLRNRPQRETYSFNQTKDLLQKMLYEEYSDNIAIELLYPKHQLKSFLNNTNRHDYNIIKLIMQVTLKASKNLIMEKNFREFLNYIIESNFTKKTLDKLVSIDLIGNFDCEIFKLLISFFKLFFETIPGLAYEPFYPRVNNLSLLIDNFRFNSTSIPDQLFQDFNDLKGLSELSNPYLKLQKQKGIKFIYDDKLEPPDNFREISIFPKTEDFDVGNKDVFLRRNKDRGVYKSVDDYLDIQFRLMREDFIQPLRDGLTSMKNEREKRRLDIRIYRNTFIVNSLPADRIGIIYNVNFDISRLKKVKWIQSKRFLYGSLLCLSHDNFKTLLFATVANRDIRELENGFISVKFCDCVPVKDRKYTMVETTNMFESYRHVLRKLQETNADNLSFQKYLVFADENITLPAYLIRNRVLEYKFMNSKFFPGNPNSIWPRAVDLELDESQFQAFKTSLTKEITIIQGPPGTGKTYLGLKICRCLLDNIQQTVPRFGPILIVCYTNHALDQFLEGISKFTTHIIRIGNRSKSELLQNYSLLNWKKKYNDVNLSQMKRKIFGKMRDLKDDIIQIQAGLKMSHDILLPLDKLRIFINSDHFQIIQDIRIRNWLNGENLINELSNIDIIVDNIIEWIIYEEMMTKLNSIIIEAQVELVNNDEEEYVEDNDLEVNFINNHRRLDIDEDDLTNLNVEFQNVIGKMSAITFDDDILPMSNDGFTPVKTKLTKKLMIRKLHSDDKMTEEQVNRIRYVDQLSIEDRWKLYRFWRSKYIESLDERSKMLESAYENLANQLNEIHFEEDRKLMMDQSVVGMTTTGAARYGRVLAQIQCKIIIVEEAAEVLESHIIASLNPGCEHLILIGDHKQLKPNPTVYELSKTYNLDLSLFERLVNNHLHYNTLELQHRMRPEIAEIMRFIYENLKNHTSVLDFPNIPGVGTNIYFFNHSEQESHNDEISSYSNEFEAEFVVQFCRHLMKNGVENSRITVLTLYSGQLFLLRTKMPKTIFEGIRVCVVDNYQGEENDIIILSLVRSNENDKIGFLSIENRICVCLSRAKMGLFVFGNFQILANNNELWKNICGDLRRKSLLGDTLMLRCQNHPDKKLEIKHFKDFSKYPEGGCEELCNQRLVCGHACRRACHFLDKNHQSVKCLESCTKLCPNGHRCHLKCWQTCPNCQTLVLKTIPGCLHKQIMSCFRTPEPNLCEEECGRDLACGHKCLRQCKDKCEGCLKKVMKISPECGHEAEYCCSDKDIICNKKCTEMLDCEHLCKGTCGKCNYGRLHESCSNKCKNQLICGHICKAWCSLNCPPCNERCEEGCVHNRCPKRCGDECVPCSEKCKWKCKHKICTKKCYENCDRDVCDEGCLKLKDCKNCRKRFQCYGICGEPCRTVCLKCDPEVKEIFFGTEDGEDVKFITLWTCGHSFECESMDRYMATVPDNGEIVQKRCPRCNTVINKRSCFRYLNIVRKIYQDIKDIQKLITKNELNTDFQKLINKVEIYWPKINVMFDKLKLDNYFSRVIPEGEPFSNYDTSKYNKSLEFVYNIYNTLFKNFGKLDKILDIDYQYVEKSITFLLNWLDPKKRNFSVFETKQCNCEFERIEQILNLTETRKKQPYCNEIPDFIEELKRCHSFSEKFADDFRENWKTYITKKGYLPNMGITDRERKEIVSAIGLSKGRWFKCPNGHFYVIGECGGATQIAKCAECNAQVGGQRHQVLSDNVFAPEMDGARHPAFSEAANILNFRGFEFL